MVEASALLALLALLARTVEASALLALLARTVEASPLARTVEELWAPAMALPLSQLSEQAIFCAYCAQPCFNKKTYEQAHAEFVIVIFFFWLTIVLWHVGCFTGGRCSISFFGLSMLSSYCRRVLIALRSYSECKYFMLYERKAVSV